MDEAELEKYFERFLFANCWIKNAKTPVNAHWRIAIREFLWNTKIMVQKLQSKWDENNRKTEFTPRPFPMHQNKLWKSTTHWWKRQSTSLLAPYLEFFLFPSNSNNNTFTDCLITHCITELKPKLLFLVFRQRRERRKRRERDDKSSWLKCLPGVEFRHEAHREKNKPSAVDDAGPFTYNPSHNNYFTAAAYREKRIYQKRIETWTTNIKNML